MTDEKKTPQPPVEQPKPTPTKKPTPTQQERRGYKNNSISHPLPPKHPRKKG